MSATHYSNCPSSIDPRLCLHDSYAPARAELEAFVHSRYAAIYQANIQYFLPFFLATWQGSLLQGVLGLRPGASGTFFVENYLDSRIENIVAQQQGAYVPREQIVETGNLVGSRGSSQLLFVMLTEVLYRAGFRWITFTATPLVINSLNRLGFAPQVLCEANVARLGAHAKEWGSYYDNKPSVAIGNIEQAYRTLQNNELALKLLQEYRVQIDAVVSTLSITLKGNSDE